VAVLSTPPWDEPSLRSGECAVGRGPALSGECKEEQRGGPWRSCAGYEDRSISIVGLCSYLPDPPLPM
ncbi:MAG: hypothetical protein ACOYD1_13770, partial [Candidatus Nanopelagicales bacterium]